MATKTAWDLAESLGIVIEPDESGLFRVGTSGDLVLYAWHPDPAVCEARAFEGIAQCLLERAGCGWTAHGVRKLAYQLRSGSGTWDRAPVTQRMLKVH